MPPQQIAKLRARAEHLLDLFISLLEKFAMLRPLAFDEELAGRVGAGPRGRGHTILKNTLLQSCVQDLVKLTLDRDPRTPSVSNLMTTLEDSTVRDALLADYAAAPRPVLAGAPSLVLDEIQSDEAQRLTDDFQATWSDLATRWPTLEDDGSLLGFKKWRDKLIAHSELHHVDGEYVLTDLSQEDLKWSDFGKLIKQLQGTVDSITILTRSAGFAWDTLGGQLDETSDGFWSLVGQAEGRGAV